RAILLRHPHHLFSFPTRRSSDLGIPAEPDRKSGSAGAEMPHDLSHLGFLAGQIGRLITISTTPVIAGDSFEMDAVGALRLSPLRSEERFSRNAETDVVCRLLLEQ